MANGLSMRLFGDEEFENSRRLMRAVDELDSRFGRDTVLFYAAQPGGRWETKFLRWSQCYTTCISDVLRVD